jgi:hypothetical protein
MSFCFDRQYLAATLKLPVERLAMSRIDVLNTIVLYEFGWRFGLSMSGDVGGRRNRQHSRFEQEPRRHRRRRLRSETHRNVNALADHIADIRLLQNG